MAIGAITVSKRVAAPGPLRADVITFTGDTSYPTGGTANFQALVRDALDVGAIDILAVVPIECGGYVPQYDEVTDKLKVYVSAAAASALGQVANATSLAATTFKVLVISN